jgi:uncharacterized protein (DUF305 family)
VSGRKREPSLALVLAVVALAGCGDDDKPETAAVTAPHIVQPGAPGEPSQTLSQEELDAVEPTPHTSADVAFMKGMIHHHAQALHMTALVPKRTTNPDIRLLAKRIDISQESEIDQMTTWLESRGEIPPVWHREHGHAHGAGRVLMPGMLTDADIERLAAARGRAFDRLFLRDMIRHHQGALTMVQELYDAGGGAEPDAGVFVRHVESDQQIEIDRMQQLLNAAQS